MIKVISGGQTGVDQAALMAAKAAGIATGGWMAHGWQTLDGIHEEFRELFCMEECPDRGYSPRTVRNVRDSDGTLCIAKNFTSPGELCTHRAVLAYRKPSFSVRWHPVHGMSRTAQEVINWIIVCGIDTLNVAGNSEQTARGIQTRAYDFLLSVFLLWCSGIRRDNGAQSAHDTAQAEEQA